MKILIIILAAILTMSLCGQTSYKSRLETDTMQVFKVSDSLNKNSVVKVEIPYNKGTYYKTVGEGKNKTIIKIVVQ